jgi:hypothetical protein
MWHAWGKERRGAYRVFVVKTEGKGLVVKPEGKRLLGRPRHR